MASFRTGIISVLLCVALGGCATIETRGLAKCSGKDRRPLNGDLWQWYEQQPVSGAQEAVQPLQFVQTNFSSPAMAAIDQAISQDEQARWNIEKSLEKCR